MKTSTMKLIIFIFGISTCFCENFSAKNQKNGDAMFILGDFQPVNMQTESEVEELKDRVTISRCRASCIDKFVDEADRTDNNACKDYEQCYICWVFCEDVYREYAIWKDLCEGDYNQYCEPGCQTACNFVLHSEKVMFSKTRWIIPSVPQLSQARENELTVTWSAALPPMGMTSSAIVYIVIWKAEEVPFWNQAISTLETRNTLTGPHGLYTNLKLDLLVVTAQGIVNRINIPYPPPNFVTPKPLESIFGQARPQVGLGEDFDLGNVDYSEDSEDADDEESTTMTTTSTTEKTTTTTIATTTTLPPTTTTKRFFPDPWNVDVIKSSIVIHDASFVFNQNVEIPKESKNLHQEPSLLIISGISAAATCFFLSVAVLVMLVLRKNTYAGKPRLHNIEKATLSSDNGPQEMLETPKQSPERVRLTPEAASYLLEHHRGHLVSNNHTHATTFKTLSTRHIDFTPRSLSMTRLELTTKSKSTQIQRPKSLHNILPSNTPVIIDLPEIHDL